MKSSVKHSFEQEYFRGRYKNVVGSFSSKELEISRRWFQAWLYQLNKYIPIQDGKDKRVLEIGCSIGGVASLLVERGFDVTATDVSEYAITRARKLSPHISFQTLDILKPIPIQKKFDIIISFEVVEHLDHPEKAIENIYDKLKPGGYIVFSTPYPYPWSWNDMTHINVLYPNQWINMMRQVGFQDVSYHKFSLIPFFYKIHPRLQVALPFHIPVPFINNPILYIGKK